MIEPKSSVAQDASTRKDEGRTAGVDSRKVESATDVKTRLPAPVCAEHRPKKRGSPRGRPKDRNVHLWSLPVYDRHKVERMRDWIKACDEAGKLFTSRKKR